MKKSLISAAIVTAGMIAAPSAQAALASNAVLEMGAQTYSCPYGLGTPPACLAGNQIPEANYFAMDTDGSGIHEPGERVALSGGTDLGLALNANQTSIGTSTGNGPSLAITGPGQIDAGWPFFGSAGWHTANGVAVAGGDDGTDGVATLDMSSLVVMWNGQTIPMGGSTTFVNGITGATDTGLASVQCTSGTNTCALGETFVLDYEAHVPLGFGFDNVFYTMHLSGVIGAATSAVPVPAAVWLFGSGLLGLVGVARRKAVA